MLHDVKRCKPSAIVHSPRAHFNDTRVEGNTFGMLHPVCHSLSAPSRTIPTIQPALTANLSPPAGGNTSTRDILLHYHHMHPRVNVTVSGEDDLDSFPRGLRSVNKSTYHTEKSNVSSSLSLVQAKERENENYLVQARPDFILGFRKEAQ